MNTGGQIIVFTDGSSRGNPGPGGWGAVVVAGEGRQTQVTELGGGEPQTTNNRMELTAAAAALERVPEGAEVTLYTDSSYVINGITKWVAGWKRNGWRTQAKADVLNKDLWIRLSDAAASRRIKWLYVGGHIGIKGNERCDEIATQFADGHRPALYAGSLSGYGISGIADISHDEALFARKKAGSSSSGSSRSGAKAYSYVSRVGGVTQTHATWAECEKRVKGVKGARFKKALTAEEERALIEEFSR